MAKKKRVKSKAARVTQAKREERRREEAAAGGGGPVAEEYKGGGLLTGMRSGFQSAVGAGPRKKQSWTSTVIYVLVLAAAVAFVYGMAR